jgi:K+-sensing histidine kinase KdpD
MITASRGKLRIHLGAAPGVGKTYAMLDEGRRRRDRGTGVLVGFVETHGRTHTAEMLDGLGVLPRRTVNYRCTDFTELDVAAVIRRASQVVLVDELAHTNVPGTGNRDSAAGDPPGRGGAPRELAPLWLADKVDEQLDQYRADHDITGTWEARERVVVALTGGPEGDTVASDVPQALLEFARGVNATQLFGLGIVARPPR